jgi:glycosyltransferase involved in cell wall biosynthesis
MIEKELRVAIILPSLANMGPISVARDIVSNLKDKVKIIEVFYFDDIVELDFECRVKRISFFTKIDFSTYDVVHTHMLRPDMYLAYHRVKTIKRITTIHSNIIEDLSHSYGSFIGQIASKIWMLFLQHDTVAVLTKDMYTYYERKISNAQDRLKVVYNGRKVIYDKTDGILISEKKQLEKLKDKCDILIGSVGSLIKRKGIDQLLLLLKLNVSFGLILVGDGDDYKRLKEKALNLKIQERVIFLGRKQNPFKYYEYFDVSAFTSYSEGFPLSLLEAIQMNKACIVSDLKIYSELFKNDEEIIIYQLENIQDLNKKIEYAYKHRDLLTHNALKRVNKDYSVESMANKYLKLYAK